MAEIKSGAKVKYSNQQNEEETGVVYGVRDSVAYVRVETRNGVPVEEREHSTEECTCEYTPVPFANLTVVGFLHG